MIWPIPKPTTIMAMVVSNLVESTLRRVRSQKPTSDVMVPTIGKTLYLPVCDTIRPATTTATTTASINGISTTPEFVADAPSTPCTNSGM